MRLDKTECLGVERSSWTKDIVYNENGTDALSIRGDFYTLEYGSDFTIYKQADKHLVADEKEGADDEINSWPICSYQFSLHG